MSVKWRYLNRYRREAICKKKENKAGQSPRLYGSDYRGCCGSCPFCGTSRGEHWTQDEVWCNAPTDAEYGKKIIVSELERYRIVTPRKKSRKK